MSTVSDVPYALRLPRKVHAAMKKLAKENRRSLNAEIVTACEKHSTVVAKESAE